jgi:signal recognition particle GTPase
LAQTNCYTLREEISTFIWKQILVMKTDFTIPADKTVCNYGCYVNWVGKSTTIGKLASQFKNKDWKGWF